MDAITLFLMVRWELLMPRLLEKMLFFCGYGDVRKGCADALQQAHARIIINEISSICALTATMEGVLKMKDIITVIHIRGTSDELLSFVMSWWFRNQVMAQLKL
ncbi:hypothetical protein Golob_004191 [Gossypium lobatum]|uniref:Adenosylhomocysteinase n=1 Tax=Gossypium lobatum TaxID=34289 RepID=A0A7J8N129_9ROSI|nr:hypothetical protein [Gossypium lobatum]